MENTTCNFCHKQIQSERHWSGYGTTSTGLIACYACCAEMDKARMRDTGKITLYLDESKDLWKVTSWADGLSFPVIAYTTGKHNIGGTQTNVWFLFEGDFWHGRQIGGGNTLCYCQRTQRTTLTVRQGLYGYTTIRKG